MILKLKKKSKISATKAEKMVTGKLKSGNIILLNTYGEVAQLVRAQDS